ncbi:TIGR03118 family protein [Flavisolibacter ginsenosidimutans]|uniref:TIGR03118 family protein n=1 Tax=Flavisolibacter ginsenosidimutans TaxID=661481 RepID=A0A5B8UJS1_9BACT|nr:TIGR03118 family protein [Flavisolibacter ginsenosidimutans]QEC56399.1 TIGR03118 family protein [Flavisolibacter ginsenosidimutans]
MNKTNTANFLRAGRLALALTALFVAGCQKSIDKPASTNPLQADEAKAAKDNNGGKKIGHFTQVNLVANNSEYGAAFIDPTLMNAWGIAFAPNGTAWVNSQEGHVSEVYTSEGAPTALGRVNIPLPAATTGGNPTGIVFNGSNTAFIIPGSSAARFIFVGVDGVLSAWNGAQGTTARRIAAVPQSAFTGLTTGAAGTDTFLYAANFAARKINVWNKSFAPVVMPFSDPGIPAGYAPFNIQNIDGLLYVTYAKVAANGESQAGMGLGYVDVYNTAGVLVKRFASGGTLNAPWGLAKVPASFFGNDEADDDDSGPMILVGNFGDGRINAYTTSGKFKGQLRGSHGHDMIQIEGLWAITLPPATSTIDQRRLYFAAGPDDETHGLFGYIIARMDDGDLNDD